MCEQGKFPLHLRPSLGQMGKQFHAGAVKPELGFCGSGFGFFQSVRCPIRWTKVTDALGTRLYSRWHLKACSVANILRGVMGTRVNPDRCRIRVDGQIQFEYGAVWTWEFLNPEKRSC